jgi:hypothetical protein
LVNLLKENETLRKQLEEDIRAIIQSQNKVSPSSSQEEILEDVE